jgi:hypothetical protein
VNRGYAALYMADPSLYDARNLGETAGVAYPLDNAGQPAQKWKIYITGCLGHAERIIR